MLIASSKAYALPGTTAALMAFSRLVCAILLTLHHEAHGTGRASDGTHGGVQIGGSQIGSFALAISSSCLRVTLPTFSVFGRLEPDEMPAAFFSRVVAGVLLVMKVNVRSSRP